MKKFIFVLACAIGFIIPTQVEAKTIPSSCKFFASGRMTCSYSYGNNRSWSSYNPYSGYSSNGWNSYGYNGYSWGSYNYSTPYGSGYKSYTYNPYYGYTWNNKSIWDDYDDYWP